MMLGPTFLPFLYVCVCVCRGGLVLLPCPLPHGSQTINGESDYCSPWFGGRGGSGASIAIFFFRSKRSGQEGTGKELNPTKGMPLFFWSVHCFAAGHTSHVHQFNLSVRDWSVCDKAEKSHI